MSIPARDRTTQLEAVLAILMSRAQGGWPDEAAYKQSRAALLSDRDLAPLLPEAVVACRDLDTFWGYIQPKFSTYRERRNHLNAEFAPAFAFAESADRAPGDAVITDGVGKLDWRRVHAAWNRALDARAADPEGAITQARTLLETVLKHILDEARVEYDPRADLPALYRSASQQLSLSPADETDEVLRRLGQGCTTIAKAIGELRNREGDAHGKGIDQVAPAPAVASFAVNVAGSLAMFLMYAWNERRPLPELPLLE